MLLLLLVKQKRLQMFTLLQMDVILLLLPLLLKFTANATAAPNANFKANADDIATTRGILPHNEPE